MARVIQSTWRRRQASFVITGEKEVGRNEFNLLLQDLIAVTGPRRATHMGLSSASSLPSPRAAGLGDAASAAPVSSSSNATSPKAGGGTDPTTLSPAQALGARRAAEAEQITLTLPDSIAPTPRSSLPAAATQSGSLESGGVPGVPLPGTPSGAGAAASVPASPACGMGSGLRRFAHRRTPSRELRRNSGNSDDTAAAAAAAGGGGGDAPSAEKSPTSPRSLMSLRGSSSHHAAASAGGEGAASGASNGRVSGKPPPPLELPPPPSIDEAKKYARDLLVRQGENDDRPGELYPLYTSLRNFDKFGTDISQYMHFMYWSARLFFALFMLNLSNLVINWEGEQLVNDSFKVGCRHRRTTPHTPDIPCPPLSLFQTRPTHHSSHPLAAPFAPSYLPDPPSHVPVPPSHLPGPPSHLPCPPLRRCPTSSPPR